jgi:hypothetical protein
MLLHPYYATKFELLFATKHGAAFQDLMSEVLDRCFAGDFMKVKPYGSQGDKKCDGIAKSSRRFFQVYAPGTMKSAAAIQKIKEDFPGAVKHWAALFDEWIFVHNQTGGLPPDVAQTLIQLDGKEGKKITQWSHSQIAGLVEGLGESDLQALLGPLPDFRNLSKITLADIRAVVAAVAQTQAVAEQIGAVPGGKLEANALSDDVKTLLRAGAQKSKLVGDLFHKWHDPQLGDRVASAFRAKYLELKEHGIVGDDAFHQLWVFAGAGQHETSAREVATLALLTFLFEECDIFEAAVQKANA